MNVKTYENYSLFVCIQTLEYLRCQIHSSIENTTTVHTIYLNFNNYHNFIFKFHHY